MADGMIIGHDNRFVDGVPVATDTDADPDFDARNVNDLRKYTKWRGLSAGQKYLTVDAGIAKEVTTLGIRGHNLGTAEGEVIVESSPGLALSDSFDNASFDAVNFGLVVAAAGTGVETTQFDITSLGAGDAVLPYDKNKRGDRAIPWDIKHKCKSTPSASAGMVLLGMYQDSVSPAVFASSITSSGKIKAWIEIKDSGAIWFVYRAASGGYKYWDGAAWVGAAGAYLGAVGTVYVTRFIFDGTNLTYQLWNSTETVKHAEAVIAMNEIHDDELDDYFIWGDPSTASTVKGTMASYLYEHNGEDGLGSSYVTRLAAFTPDSDGLIFRRLPSASDRYWRVGINTATVIAELGILILGQRVELPYSADATIELYDEGTKGATLEDDSDELLGTTVTHKSRRLNFSVSTVERSFVFGDWQALWDDHLSDLKPIIIAVYPDDFPEAIWFMFPVPNYRWKTPLRILSWAEMINLSLRGPKEIIPAEDV